MGSMKRDKQRLWHIAVLSLIFIAACLSGRYVDQPLPQKTARPEIEDMIPVRLQGGVWVQTALEPEAYVIEGKSAERLGAYIRELEAERDSLRDHPAFKGGED